MVFGRDMFFDLEIPLLAEWELIQRRRPQLVDEALCRMNLKRRSYDCAPNQQVLKKLHKPNKLGLLKEGPYRMISVHTNGTITMELRPGVNERISIRRVISLTDNPLNSCPSILEGKSVVPAPQ